MKEGKDMIPMNHLVLFSQRKFQMKKILLICAVSLMAGLSACGSGGNAGENVGGGEEVSSGDKPYQENLPADPGEAGEATLAGIDTNENGVRDDLERAAALTASTEENFTATIGLIEALQQTINPSTDGTNVDQVTHSVYCAMRNRPESAEDDLPEEVLRLLVFDTRERKEAYVAYNQLYGVKVISEEDLSCEQ
jgi:hypothetical protein